MRAAADLKLRGQDLSFVALAPVEIDSVCIIVQWRPMVVPVLLLDCLHREVESCHYFSVS